MQINGNPLQSLYDNSVTGRDKRSDRPFSDAPKKPNDQAAYDQQDVEISDAARQAAANQQVVPVNRSESNQSNYSQNDSHQYYPSSASSEGLSSGQQRALQAYSATQQISRESEGSGEFLGGVDVFV